MENYNKTVLLGSRNLGTSDRVLPYNMETFKDPNIYLGLGLLSSEAAILSEEPTTETIGEIYNILKSLPDYTIIDRSPSTDESQKEFIFENDNIGVVQGEGFNVLIFLAGDDIIGFTILITPKGYKTQTPEEATSYKLKRSYNTRTVKIILTLGENNVKVDEGDVNITNDLVNQADEDRDFSGKEPWNYAKKGDLKKDTRGIGNYSIYLSSVVRPGSKCKDIFTDTTYCKYSSGSLSMAKLGIPKNISLGVAYSDFTHEQLGYYKNDLALFVWNDENQYSVFSITKTVDDVLGSSNVSQRLFPYTYPREGVGSTEIYTLPAQYEGQELKILYFAGRYIAAECDSSIYLFDIDRQEWIVDSWETTGIDYRKWDGSSWVPDVNEEYRISTNVKILPSENFITSGLKTPGTIIGIEKRKPIYLTKFLADRMSERNILVKLKTLTWQSYLDAIQEYGGFSNTYGNSENTLMNNDIPVGKIGDWFIFEDTNNSSYIYSNMTKSIKIRKDENPPIIINDQALMTWESEGGNLVYCIYNSPGYFMSYNCYKYLGTRDPETSELLPYSDRDSRGHVYTVYTKETDADRYVTIKTADSSESSASSPIVIQKSFLSAYRRNVLPITMNGFRIIGGFAGLIFYRIGNTINYL